MPRDRFRQTVTGLRALVFLEMLQHDTDALLLLRSIVYELCEFATITLLNIIHYVKQVSNR